MDSLLSRLRDWNPGGDGKLTHQHVTAILKAFDENDKEIKLVLNRLSNPVSIEEFVQWIYSRSPANEKDTSNAKASAALAEMSADPAGPVASTAVKHGRVVLVGIAGPSCGGKSTLAQALAERLRSPVRPVPLDGYFMPHKMPHDPEFGMNWELPEGVDFERLRGDIAKVVDTLNTAKTVPRTLVISGSPGRGGGNMVRKEMVGKPLDSSVPLVVVAEGFLLFHNDALAKMFDAFLWIDVPCEVCSHRRHQRDCPRVNFKEYHRWYEGLVWSHFLRFSGKQLENAPGALHLDGSDVPDALLVKSAAFCRDKFGLRKCG